MPNANKRGDKATKWIRWVARGLGSLIVVFWLFMGIVSVIDEPEPWTLESMVMAGFIITVPLILLIAWWREGIGGMILVIYAIGFSTFGYISAGHNKAFAMMISGGPFLLTGILFLTSWWRSKRYRTNQEELNPGSGL